MNIWDPSLWVGALPPTTLVAVLLRQHRSTVRIFARDMRSLVSSVQEVKTQLEETRKELRETRADLKEQARVASEQATKIEVVISRLTTLEGQRVGRLEQELITLREHYHKLADKVQSRLLREAADVREAEHQ